MKAMNFLICMTPTETKREASTENAHLFDWMILKQERKKKVHANGAHKNRNQPQSLSVGGFRLACKFN